MIESEYPKLKVGDRVMYSFFDLKRTAIVEDVYCNYDDKEVAAIRLEKPISFKKIVDVKCKDCNAVGCSYRTSDAEKECQFQGRLIRLPDEWQNVRIQASIAAMQGVMNFFGSIDYNKETIAQLAVEQADALIEELKKK